VHSCKCSLAAQSGLAKEFAAPLRSAYNYIDITQVPEDVPQLKKYYRRIAYTCPVTFANCAVFRCNFFPLSPNALDGADISKGAWPFSTRDHGWPIADCTGEGLTAAFRILDTGYASSVCLWKCYVLFRILFFP
jgi:hypothetical protein